jgi:hypothetical protein
MNSQMLMAVLIVVAAIGGVTWLAINAHQPRLRSFFRHLLLTWAAAMHAPGKYCDLAAATWYERRLSHQRREFREL